MGLMRGQLNVVRAEAACMPMSNMTTTMARQLGSSPASSSSYPRAAALHLLKATTASFNVVPSANLTSSVNPAGMLTWTTHHQLASSNLSPDLHPPGLLHLHDHTGHDLLCTIAVFASSFLWIRLFDFLVEKNVLERKLSRKLVHITTGIVYALLWPLFSVSPWSRYFALAIPFANAIRLLVYGLGIVKDEALVKSMSRSGSSRELLRGPFYYVIVLAACTVLFWRDSPVGMVALAIMCGGDGIADIMGRKLGCIKLPYNSNKSWVGSISMFAFSFVLSISLLYYYSSLGFYRLNWSNAVQTVALISLAATIVESLPISRHLDDNMSVPLVTLLLGSALFPGVIL